MQETRKSKYKRLDVYVYVYKIVQKVVFKKPGISLFDSMFQKYFQRGKEEETVMFWASLQTLERVPSVQCVI